MDRVEKENLSVSHCMHGCGRTTGPLTLSRIAGSFSHVLGRWGRWVSGQVLSRMFDFRAYTSGPAPRGIEGRICFPQAMSYSGSRSQRFSPQRFFI